MVKVVIIPLFLFLLVSCGKEFNSIVPNFPEASASEVESTNAISEQYSYEFHEKSCYTGNHKSATFKGICSALSNHNLNENCASNKRESLFLSSSCPGVF